jgi:hypothetical protein
MEINPMKKIVAIGLTSLVLTALNLSPAQAFFHGGGGSWNASGARGTASGGDGSWNATGAYGATASGGYDHYYGGTYYGAYHPPTVVNTYSTGCSNCGGWYAAGAAATGAVIGATAANVNNANTYAEGYAAGAENTAYAMGAIYPTLPPGATIQTIGSATYYLYNGVWFSPSYGANGVYYRVVPTP